MQVATTTCTMARSLADGTYAIRLSGRSACANYLSGAACPSAALSFVAAGRICCICNSSREGRYLMQSWDYSL